MLVPLLILVVALAAALTGLLMRLGRLRARAEQAGARLAEIEGAAARAAAASRVAPESPPAETEPRPDAAERRPARRGRRVTALPDRP